MKILITGATGFVGSHMAYQAHLMGHEVVLSKRANSKMHLFESVRKWYSNGPNNSNPNNNDPHNNGPNNSNPLTNSGSSKENNAAQGSGSEVLNLNVQSDTKSDFLSVEQVAQLKSRVGLPQLKNVLTFNLSQALNQVAEHSSSANDHQAVHNINTTDNRNKADNYSQTAVSKIQDFQPQWVEMDLQDTDDILDILDDSYDVVMHCAAIVSFDKKSEEKMIQENTDGTRNLINACLKQGVKKFVHISSIAALGRPENDQPIRIDSEWVDSKYNTAYANSKYLAEMEVWRGKEEGLQVLILNPGVILGFGEAHTSSEQVANTVRKGIPAYPAGSNGFVFVDDLAYSALMMLTQESNYGKRHLMVSHNLTFRYLMQELAQVLGVHPPKFELSGWKFQLSYWSIRLVELLGISMPISTELLMSTRRNSVYSGE